jgi:GTP-binding protein
MKFVDEARILVKAGDGGNGCISFRREKFVPLGGPDGGDGGKGGDILLKGNVQLQSLLDVKIQAVFKAPKGTHGKGKNKTGRAGEDRIIQVPAGTMVWEEETGILLADLTEDGAKALVARGGAGGRGNAAFAHATRQAPRFAKPGHPGQERRLRLELKLLADVGLVGFPNAGKSTLIAQLTPARPKVGAYPFTTLTPQLGMAEDDQGARFVVADIPGILAGAHRGAGLGLRFLRHIERTRLLLFVLDAANPEIGPWEQYRSLAEELVAYRADLKNKQSVTALNKVDLLPTDRQREAHRMFREQGMDLIPISALTGEGIPALKEKLGRIFKKMREGNSHGS